MTTLPDSTTPPTRRWRVAVVAALALVAGVLPALSASAGSSPTTTPAVSVVTSAPGEFTWADWRAGTLYVGHQYGDYNASGNIISVPTATATATSISYGNGIGYDAAAGQGGLYIANHALWRQSPDGTVTVIADNIGDHPSVAVDPTGHYAYLAAFDGTKNLSSVTRYDLTNSSAAPQLVAGGASNNPITGTNYNCGAAPAPPFRTPEPAIGACLAMVNGMAVRGTSLYINDYLNGWIHKVDLTTGTIQTITPQQLSMAQGMTVDAAGNVYYLDEAMSSSAGWLLWMILGATGSPQVVAGGGSTPASQVQPGSDPTAVLLKNPRDVTVDTQGNLYVTDNDTITGPAYVLKVSGVAPPARNLTVQSPASGVAPLCAVGGGAPAACASLYPLGSTVTVTVTPGAGMGAVWTGCDSSSGTTCTVTMNTDRIVQVALVPVHTLTVATYSADKVGSGNVVSTVGSISCPAGSPATCSEVVPYLNGQPGQVTLNALPAAGSYLSGWNGCDNNAVLSCVVTMSSDKTVTASFQACPVGSCSPFTGPDTSFDAVCPVAGTAKGGSLVTLTGKNLVATDKVLFDGTAGTTVSASTDGTALTVRTPAHAAAPVKVTLEGLPKDSTTFTYTPAPPQLSGIAPGAAFHVNAGRVTMTGTNLFDVAKIQVGSGVGGHVVTSCDGTTLQFTPPDAALTVTSDPITVTTANGTSNALQLGRVDPLAQGPTSSSYTPVTQGLLPTTSSTQPQSFHYATPDGASTISVTVPAGDLPVGTRLDIYRADTTGLKNSLPAGSVVQSGFAVAWTAPDGSHPPAKTPLTVQVVDPSITPRQTTFAATENGQLSALPVSLIVPPGVHKIALVSGQDRHIDKLIPVNPGDRVSGGQVIAAGSGNVIAAGGGNLTFAGGFVIPAGAGNVIAAGSGNVIAAGAGNIFASAGGVIAAGAGNVIAAGSGNFVSRGAMVAAALHVQGAAVAHLAPTADPGYLISVSGAGVGSMTMSGDPQFVRIDPPAAPGAPTDVQAKIEGTAARLTWKAPTSVGGAPVTSYSVQVIQDGQPGMAIPYPDASTSVAVPVLVTGHSYQFAVTAFNGGFGPASSPSKSLTLPTVTAPAPTPSGPESSATKVVSATSTDPHGTATAVSKDAAGHPVVSAIATGAGTVTVGQYPADPVGAPTFHSAGQYFDVHATGGFTSLTITRCGLAGGSTLQFWSGSAWQPVVGSAYPPADPGCVSVTLTGMSTPTIAQLTGTVFGVASATVTRVAGADRIGTAVAASQAGFADATAGAVVLARSDAFADSLAGTPLAVAQHAPLLLTSGARLDPAVLAEVQRVLAPGGTVYLLGGPAALGEPVSAALVAAGYQVSRVSGPDRYATAVAIAGVLGNPSTVFLATGRTFADGLSAGVAAARTGGVVLFTDGASVPAVTAGYLTAYPGLRYAVGGPAAQAAPGAVGFAGADRYATAALVAGQFFPAPDTVGLASGTTFPDALSAGPGLARVGAPLLLTAPDALPAATRAYLAGDRAALRTVTVYGGTAAVGTPVTDAVGQVLSGG